MRQMKQRIAIVGVVLLLVIIIMPSLALYAKLSENNPIKGLQKSDILSAWKDDVRLTNDSADSIRVDIAVDTKNNPHVVWGDMKIGIIKVYYKTCDGINWTDDMKIESEAEKWGGHLL